MPVGDLHGLIVLSMLMTEDRSETDILRLATTTVPALSECQVEGVFLDGLGWQHLGSRLRTLARQQRAAHEFPQLGPGGGLLRHDAGEDCLYGYPIRSTSDLIGYLVVSTAPPIEANAEILLRILAQLTGVALANARLHDRELAVTERLEAANKALEQTVEELHTATNIHRLMTNVALERSGFQGIADAVHKLTRRPVRIEDVDGNRRATSGTPNITEPRDRAAQTHLLDLVSRAGAPVDLGDRLVAIARPQPDLTAILVIEADDRPFAARDLLAAEHASTVLAMELARLRSIAEAEMRLRRDLVEDLLAGVDIEGSMARARALGVDLSKPQHVIVIERANQPTGEEHFFHTVRRVCRNLGVAELMVGRLSEIVVIWDAQIDYHNLATELHHQAEGRDARIGVGGRAETAQDLQRSLKEARLALNLQQTSQQAATLTSFDDLGIYCLMAQIPDHKEIYRFVRRWIGPLIDHDAEHRTEYVKTLSAYFVIGRNYDAVARELCVHRSTLKYRMQRIREISDWDMRDPDADFNIGVAVRAWQSFNLGGV